MERLSLWGLRATLFGMEGHRAEAAHAARRLLEIANTSEDTRVVCNARLIAAVALRAVGEDTVPLCRQVLRNAQRTRLASTEVTARRVLAEALADASQLDEAWAQIGAADDRVRALERPVQLAEVLVTRARVASLRGDPVALDEVRAILAGTDVGEGSRLGRALATVEAGSVLRVDAEGRWFALPGADPVDLARRHPIRRVLLALVQAHREGGGGALDVEALLAAGWPDERVRPQAAGNRVYNAVATLRRAGLREVVERVEGGYRIAPGVRVALVG